MERARKMVADLDDGKRTSRQIKDRMEKFMPAKTASTYFYKVRAEQPKKRKAAGR
jgi:hypothetical protein